MKAKRTPGLLSYGETKALNRVIFNTPSLHVCYLASQSCCSFWKTWIKNSYLKLLESPAWILTRSDEILHLKSYKTATKNIISPFETCSCLRLLYLWDLGLGLTGMSWAPAGGRDIQPEDRHVCSLSLSESWFGGFRCEWQPGCTEYSLRKFSPFNVSHKQLLYVVKVSLLCNHDQRSFV